MIEVREEIQQMLDEVRANRRYLHQHPELELDTVHTKAYLIEQIQSYGGFTIHEGYAENGFVATMKKSDDSLYIGFRTDMDALAMMDLVSCDYASKWEGRAHACGHDGHMAILLGLAHYFSRHQKEIKANIALIFQPGEEGPGGAKCMIEDGLLKDFPLSCIIGTHLMGDVEKGKIACRSGAMMARNGEVDIHLYGQSAHGAMPQLGNDALMGAASLLLQMQTIHSRNMDPLCSAVLTFGKMEAGHVRNVICDHVVLEGTMRAFDDSVYEMMKEKIQQMSEGVAKSFHLKADVLIRDGYYVVNNDEQLDQLLQQVVGEDYVLQQPKMIAEDFSFYQREVPGLFFYTGVKDDQHSKQIHNSRFDFDESALLYAIEIEVRLFEEMKGFYD